MTKTPCIYRFLSHALSVILFLFFCNSCAASQIQADFYLGLKKGAENSTGTQSVNNEKQKEVRACFERALDNPNPFIRTAAAAKLLHELSEGRDIPAPLMDRVARNAPPSWAAAFDVLAAGPALVREKALAFLLSSEQADKPFSPGVFPDEAALFVLKECLARNQNIFSPAELAAINGNTAASRSRYAEALNYFRITLEEPSIFFQYPDLINRLGRAFQYAGAGNEGIELFLKWEQKTALNGAAGNSAVKFRLLFFAGRMARHLGRYKEGVEYFRRALLNVPDKTQSDACIWYILDSVLSDQPAAVRTQILEEFMPLWHDKAYYNDILDKLVSGYVLNRRWPDIAALFPLVHNYADDASIAKYAYIIARALEDGYLSPEETVRALSADKMAASAGANPDSSGTAGRAALARAYMDIAFRSGDAALYYRLMSATAMQKPFMEIPGHARRLIRTRQPAQPNSPAMDFLKGFFSNNAAEFAPEYIKLLEKELKPDEKRSLAKIMSDAGLYAESMRLLLSCRNQDGVEFNRQDLEVCYPRPFKSYVEKYAKETNIAPELLFGLIRTESAFQSNVVSSAGAAGLTQLLPATAEETAARVRRQGGPDYSGGAALSDPEANIHIGAAYLSYLMDRTGSPLLALLAYNGGINRIRRWRNADTSLSEDLFLESIEYSETREYGRKVLAAQAVYKALYY